MATTLDRWQSVAEAVTQAGGPTTAPHQLPQGQVWSCDTTRYYGLTYRTARGVVEVRDLFTGGFHSRRVGYQVWREDSDGIVRHELAPTTTDQVAAAVRRLSVIR